LDAIPSQNLIGTVPAALKEAIDALSKLEPQLRLQQPTIESGEIALALGALRRLRLTLESESEERGLAKPEAASYLADPKSLEADLRATVSDFLVKQLKATYERVATFSLILFSEDLHGGALAESFQKARAEWRRALKPPRRGTPDLHLAIVPPPSAVDGVRYLAAELGCERKLPCVVFLGSRPEFSRDLSSPLVTWSARSLLPQPPSYPDQLGKIYQTVYSWKSLAPGTPKRALAGKFLTALQSVISPRGVLKLLAGAVGGERYVKAIETVLRSG
jgi:hypothetical protein